MNKYNTFAWRLLLLLLALPLSVLSLKAEEPSGNKDENEFDPAELIIGHVVDSHQWHLIKTPDGHHVSIHLPVILYSKHSGWHVFSSKKLAHGHTYKDFKLIEEGEQAGTIIETLPGDTKYTPLDLSITKNVVGIALASVIVLLIFLSIANKYKKNPTGAPTGLQNAMEPLILFIRDDVAKESIGGKKYERFAPFLLSVFFFILFANLLGLIPIFPAGANVTGNIGVTAVLAFFTFVITLISANKHYWKDIFNTPGVPWWLKFPLPLMPLIEFTQIFIKPIVLAIRLFANILAGHIVALGFFSLIFIFGSLHIAAGYGISVVTIAFTVFLTMLEILVAFIQAYVFTILSAIYFGLAVTEEEH